MFEKNMHPLQTAPWQRHELLYVAPSVWAVALTAQSLEGLPLLAGWADHGWPVIVRRRMNGDDVNMVPVGVPLPPAAGKLRIAISIPREAVTARAAPPSMRAIELTGKPDWEPIIKALLVLGEQHGIEPAVFGSLLWEHHTGLDYLSPTSDVDLIWPVGASCDVARLLDGIAQIERAAPMRIDGEIVFPKGGAVNWRELHKAVDNKGPAEILIKTMDGALVCNPRHLPGCERLQ
jgi:phosphoribosyl-dephospho-CoA transferase